MKCKACGAEMKQLFFSHSMFCPNDCDKKPKAQPAPKQEVDDHVPSGFMVPQQMGYIPFYPIVPYPTAVSGSGGFVFSNNTFTGSMTIDMDSISSASLGAFANMWKDAVDEAIDRWSPWLDAEEEE